MIFIVLVIIEFYKIINNKLLKLKAGKKEIIIIIIKAGNLCIYIKLLIKIYIYIP